MHKFSYNRLPISFSEMWITNRAGNPNVIRRNADDLYVPAHHFATTKRFQFFSFPKIWNDCDVIKLNPNVNIFTKSVKSALTNALVNHCAMYHTPPPPTPAPPSPTPPPLSRAVVYLFE
jgi:hypothetical protein